MLYAQNRKTMNITRQRPPSMYWSFVFSLSKSATRRSYMATAICKLPSTGPTRMRWHPLCHLSGRRFLMAWHRNSAGFVGSPQPLFAAAFCRSGAGCRSTACGTIFFIMDPFHHPFHNLLVFSFRTYDTEPVWKIMESLIV